MIKDIKYQGYHENPSDYDCLDGQLATSFNLICENGALSPIPQPKTLFHIPTGYKPIYIHNANNVCNYILRKGKELFWIKDKSIKNINLLLSGIPEDAEITIEAVGYVIYVAFYDKTGKEADAKYCYWDNDNYSVLDQNPPFVNIEFDLSLVISSSMNAENHSIAVNDDEIAKASAWANSIGSNRPLSEYEDTTFIKDVSNAVWGDFNKQTAKITEKNFFFQPFFVRYAFRLFDGSYIRMSAPVLLIPESDTPWVGANVYYEDKYLKIGVAPLLNVCQLRYRILSPDCDKLKLWTSFISHIDVFCSSPIYAYKQDENITRTVKGDSSKFTVSHYDGNEVKNYMLNDNYYWQIPSRDKQFTQNICENSLFFKIASFEINEIIDEYSNLDSDNNKFVALPIHDGILETLLSQKTLESENNLSHSTLVGAVAYNYNCRLHISSIFKKLFTGFPLRTMIQYRRISESEDYAKAQCPTIVIRTKKNNQNIDLLFTPDNGQLNDPEISPFVIDAPNDLFPRYLYFPDPDAYEMILVFNKRKSDTEIWRSYRIPLTKHVALNGAYYFRGFGDDMPEFTDFDDETPPVIPYINNQNIIFEENKVYTSEVALPFIFPHNNTVGNSNIKALSTANIALSQGQFGQYPIYAFSDQGIWALELTDEGVIKSKHIISREICSNSVSLAQLDDAVVFASKDKINIISGSNVTTISENIYSDTLFDIAQLPSVDKLIHFFNKAVPQNITPKNLANFRLVPIMDFLKDCRFLYDYKTKRIFVYNNSYIYAYVYSLKSNTWGMVFCNISNTLNSFPQSLVCDKDNNIVEYASDEIQFTNGFWITRPLKLDHPDIFKTIDFVMQRGVFIDKKISQVLYASNDLLNWIPVWSSNGKSMTGFSGSPYKYFRILAFAELLNNHTVSGCSIKFNPKLMNKPR